ncbi:polyketide synthase [Chromobacterium violaceum]|nr:polyketide synthase [Chromobacterium violaceum]
MKIMTRSHANDISLPKQERAGRQAAKKADGRLSQPVEKVAIIGFSGRFPGAKDTQAFWRLLREERSAIGEFPYWDLPGIVERRQLRETFACPGGFIHDPLAFDADFFKISAREAEAMDPQHRLALEQTWAALEDAGIPPQSLRGSDTGVYIGISSADYSGLLARAAAGAHDATGNAHSIVANRISYLFDLHGPSAPVDTACSSSLVAVHRAARAILNGECALAIAGGVNLCFEPMVFIGAAKAGMLSPTGLCRTFSSEADGYVRGEGVGIVILKDYRQALADGDNIAAVIVGSAENHGGHANSLTAPNPGAQAELIRQACRAVDIDSIDYIEVHGTGTRLGDPIEIGGLKQAFSELGHRGERRCYLGSVKTNIGHLESAAGVAGLIKTLLALRHGYMPRSLHSEPANPYIDLTCSPFEVLREGRVWPRQAGAPRRAGISSFGFGGANAHVVLEEAAPAAGGQASAAAEMFPLSAHTPEALRARAMQLISLIESQPDPSLPALAAGLQLGREGMECRLAIAADGRDSLLSGLRRYLADGGEADLSATPTSALARWRRGEQVDWRALYPDGRAQRMALPTYPFNGDTYWLRGAPTKPVGYAAPDILHPLAQRNTSDLSGLRFTSRFSGDEFFFDQHRINGERVLPGVAYLEMARAAIELSLAGDEALTRLKHIAWLRPLRHGGGELTVDIELERCDDGEIHFEVVDEAGISYCRGAAVISAAERLPVVDLSAVSAALERSLEPQQCYRIFSAMGLDYGDAFQGIRALRTGAGQTLAELARSSESAALRLPPGLLDAALQSALGLTSLEDQGGGEGAMVPFALDAAVLGDLALLAGDCFAWTRYSADHKPGRINKLDVDICNAQGQVALGLRGFSSKRLERGKIGSLTMKPIWIDRLLDSGTGESAANRLVLLADDLAKERDALAAHCLLESGVEQVTTALLPAVDGDPAASLSALAGFVLAKLKTCGRDCLVQLVVPEVDAAGAPAPAHASLLALLRTARNEGLIAGGQLIELAGEARPEWLAARLREEAGQRNEQVRLSADGLSARKVLSWREAALADDGRAPWREGGVYLLTGGAGGLGLLLAEAIAREANGARLVLASRSIGQLPEETARRIGAIRAQGADVRLEALDVADSRAVDALLGRIEREWGGLDGIFHCAGLLRDGVLAGKSEADLNAVLAAKAAGALNLDRASAHLRLDCFVLFSSLAAVIGNPGQGDYALANAFLDAFAGWRNALAAAGLRHGRALSVNWPLWRNGGMGIDSGREQWMFEQTGIRPLSDQTGLALLRRALADAASPEQLMILEGDLARIRAFVSVLEGREEPPAEQQEASATTGADDAADLTAASIRHFKQLLSKILKRPVEKIASDGSFERYGVDSIILAELTAELARTFGSLPNTLLYEHQTVAELSGYFVDKHRGALRRLLFGESAAKPELPREPARAAARRRSPTRSARRGGEWNEVAKRQGQELAIIGLSGRFPGAEDLGMFWRRLANGDDLISEVPAGRWDHAAYFDEQRDSFDKTYCKWGGFLDGVEDFDPLFFNLSPRDAEILNPNDRLFLETCWNLLEGAGLTRHKLKQQYQQQVGVFVGVMYQQYQAFESDLVRESLVSVSTPSAIANRISYFFDFQGPSLALDTMCASSISAIHAAGEALRNGDCRLAIAGGVNLTLHPKKYIGLSVGKVLGSHAGSRSFADGDGYLPAEGVGAVLLKTLADAERDGDPILAVIKSTAVNHGGRTHGFSMPSAKAQAELLETGFRRAGVDPRSIGYVEAAANGSAMGDAIELSALSRVFGEAGAAPQSCAIGSIKSNMGHAEAASGMAQLSKLVLQLRHRQLAPSLLLAPQNPKLDFASTPFALQRKLADWPLRTMATPDGRLECPRRACLSAFGAGGSNAHLVIEEYPEREPAPLRFISAPCIVPLSAKTASALRRGAERLMHHLDAHPDIELVDLAYTLQTGREAMEWRLALLASNQDELRSMLADVLRAWEPGDGLAALEALDLPICLGNVDEVPAATASLLAGPGSEAFGLGLVAADERRQLALFWTQGGEAPWDRLPEYASSTRRPAIIPLPTYAFDKKRYWLTLPSVSGQLAETGTTVPPPPSRSASRGEHGLRLLAELLGMLPDELSPAKPLASYGADSIVMVQLAMRLQTEMDAAPVLAEIMECGTVRDLATLLNSRDRRSSAGRGGQNSRSGRFLELQLLNADRKGRPVFWFHGALGGCEIYQPLAARVDRPFYGLQARGWMTERAPLQGIAKMAAYYVQAIQSVQPHGPYDLGGYSLGGMLAYETARQLQERGETVKTLVMLDSPDVTGERCAKLADATRALQAVNMALHMTIADEPERFAEVLIHRDKVDASLPLPEYRLRLTMLARQRGLKMDDKRLARMVEQSARIQDGYQVEHYRIQPLPRAEEVDCYYFRNAGGWWMGQLEPYFSTDDNEFAAFNHADYCLEWRKQLPRFVLRDIPSSNHMTLLSEAEPFEIIAEFCGGLYAQDQMARATV